MTSGQEHVFIDPPGRRLLSEIPGSSRGSALNETSLLALGQIGAPYSGDYNRAIPQTPCMFRCPQTLHEDIVDIIGSTSYSKRISSPASERSLSCPKCLNISKLQLLTR